jgi:hypothetical protein
MIDIERLGVLLDRGADVSKAAAQARKDTAEAQAAARHAQEELVEAEAKLASHLGDARGQRMLGAAGAERSRSILAHRVDTLRIQCDGLRASVNRRRAALEVITRRLNVWNNYCNALRALADVHGVEL